MSDGGLDAAVREVERRRKAARRARKSQEHAQLAFALTNLGEVLAQRDRNTEGLARIDEAILIWRRLVQADRRYSVPHLAESLRNRGVFLARLERTDEACVALRESIELFHPVAETNPDLLLPMDLAYNQLIDLLGLLGRRDDAVVVSEQRVHVFMGLAPGAGASRIGPHLGGALTKLAWSFGAVDRHDDAVDAARQSVAIFRTCRTEFEDRRAISSTVDEVVAMIRAGRLDEQGAVAEVLRRHPNPPGASLDELLSGGAPSPDDEAAVDAGLGGALFALGVGLARTHRYQEALAPAQEAVEMLRTVQRSARVDVSYVLLPAEDIVAVVLTALGRADEARPIRANGRPS